MRLDKFLANAGCGTRSEVKKLITSGNILLCGLPVRNPGYILSDTDLHSIEINGEKFSPDHCDFYMMHKPDKYLTAMKDDRKTTIAELIPTELNHLHLSPVGRLDYHTTGLLLLTSDGITAHRLLSPKNNIPKEYLVEFSGESLSQKEVGLFAQGLTLHENGKPELLLKPAKLYIKSTSSASLIITEGKTHQVRRMFAAIHRPVIKLHRISFGTLQLGNLPEGSIRKLNPEEIQELKECAGRK